MPPIVTVAEMQRMERAAQKGGLTQERMMENAGRAVAGEILRRWPDLRGVRVAVLAGSGNNGGDGLIAAEALADAGAQVGVYLVRGRGPRDPLVRRLPEKNVLVAQADQDQRQRVLKNLMTSCQIVLDAVVGTGARLPLEESLSQILETARSALHERREPAYVVALDCPSGVDCDSGQAAEEAIEADLTVTIAAAKPGLLVAPAASRVGELVVVDIGLPPLPESDQAGVPRLMVPSEARRLLPRRPRQGHKGTFGRVVVVAGSVTFPGSAALAARGAYRVGAGLVTLAGPSSIQPLLASSLPEATWLLLPHELGVIADPAVEVLSKEMGQAESLVLGPGLGGEATTASFVERLLASGEPSPSDGMGFLRRSESSGGWRFPLPPCVLDADGLKLLARIPEWPGRLPPGSVLTPHPGEMAILTGKKVEEIQADRLRVASESAQAWRCVVVLKGAFTVVAFEDRVWVMPYATPALAHAGTGDVLAGAIGGLMAQGVTPFEAAALGAFVHGRAGELAARQAGTDRGVLAGEVSECLSTALAELDSLPGAGLVRPPSGNK